MTTPPVQLLDLRSTAKAAGVSPRTLRRWAARGLLPTIRVGGTGKRFVDLRDLEALIARSKSEAAGAR